MERAARHHTTAASQAGENEPPPPPPFSLPPLPRSPEDVENKVSGAEAEVQKMEATQALANLGDPGDTVAEGTQEVVQQASLAERAAQASAATHFHMIERMRTVM